MKTFTGKFQINWNYSSLLKNNYFKNYLFSQDFTIRLNKTLDGCLKKIALVEDGFKENLDILSNKLRKMGDLEKINTSHENILLKCEKYEVNFKNLMINLTNFKNELLKIENELKNHMISQQGSFIFR